MGTQTGLWLAAACANHPQDFSSRSLWDPFLCTLAAELEVGVGKFEVRVFQMLHRESPGAAGEGAAGAQAEVDWAFFLAPRALVGFPSCSIFSEFPLPDTINSHFF